MIIYTRYDNGGVLRFEMIRLHDPRQAIQQIYYQSITSSPYRNPIDRSFKKWVNALHTQKQGNAQNQSHGRTKSRTWPVISFHTLLRIAWGL